MMKKFTILFILFFGLMASQSFAQFTGKVKFKAYKVKAGHKQKVDEGSVTLYFTPQRIFFPSLVDLDMGGSMDIKGILFRKDKNDVIIFQGNNKAVKLSKSSLISMMNMAAGFTSQTGNDGSEPESSFKKTGKTKTIDGYSSVKFIIHQMDEANQHSVIWMTNELNINWGFLADIADQAVQSFGGNNEAITNLMANKGYFPVKAKRFKNNKLAAVLKAKITATDKAKSHVNIPSGVKVIAANQYIMQMMQQMQQHSSN